MSDNTAATKIVGLDRRPYKPPSLSVPDDPAEFRRFMVRLWRRGLVAVSIMAVAGHAVVIGVLIYTGRKNIAEAFLALGATSLLLHLAFSAFEFFTRRPPTLRFEHYHHDMRGDRA